MFLNSQNHAAADEPSYTEPVVAGDSCVHGSVVGNVVQLGQALERTEHTASVTDGTTIHGHTDRKLLSKEREKKIALGHKEDDHEEEQTWQQTM